MRLGNRQKIKHLKISSTQLQNSLFQSGDLQKLKAHVQSVQNYNIKYANFQSSSRRRICLFGEVFKCLSKLIMRLLRLKGRLRSYDGYRNENVKLK